MKPAASPVARHDVSKVQEAFDSIFIVYHATKNIRVEMNNIVVHFDINNRWILQETSVKDNIVKLAIEWIQIQTPGTCGGLGSSLKYKN